jgi:hypothetical protein
MLIADVVSASAALVGAWVSPRAKLFIANVAFVFRHAVLPPADRVNQKFAQFRAWNRDSI